jgi:DUF4097 and DUF4098 domain-containing protein YvlB
MRKLIITLISIFAVIVVGLICFMVVAINAGSLRLNNKSHHPSKLELVNTSYLTLDGIDEIIMKYHADDVVFYNSDSEDFILKEYMNFIPETDEITEIRTSGSRLTLEGRTHHNHSHWPFHANRYSRMEIYLPSDYNKALKVSTSSGDISSDLVFHNTSFEASSSSGDIDLNEVYADTITSSTTSGRLSYQLAQGERRFSSSSGDIRINAGDGNTTASSTSGTIIIKNSCGELEVSSSSGDVRIEASSGRKDIETTSGEISVTASDGYTEANSSSGDIRIKGLAGAGRFQTTSGEINVVFAEDAAAILEDIRAEASSGDVTLTLPRELQFNFSAEVSSGEINTFFDDQLSFSKNQKSASGMIGVNPPIDIDISTTSGTIRIKDR